MAGFHLLQNKTALQQYNEYRRDATKLSGLCVIHTAENITALKGTDPGAENVAAYTLTRDTYGSYHVIVDADSRVDMVPWGYETFHCKITNKFSVGISMAVTSKDWPKLYSIKHVGSDRGRTIIDQAARAAADFIDYAKSTHGITVPVKRISSADARAGKPGFIAHGDTDPTRRSDPGPDFDWDYFLSRVRHHLGNPAIDERPGVTMANPATGRVTSEWGWREALSATIPRMLHGGIDIANSNGTPILAAFGGRVIKVGDGIVAGRSGNGILIENPDGEKQYYGHLATLGVTHGQTVALGEQIGTMGATGNVTGTHLHFEIWKSNDTTLNPREAFNFHGVTPGVHNLTGNDVKPSPRDLSQADGKTRVRKKYYTRAIDGDGGIFTIKALQAFLSDRGFYSRAVDGDLGPHTWNGLQRYLTIDGFYTRAVDGDAGPYTVTALQTWLSKAGTYTRSIDGDLGTHTWRALQEFLARERWVTLTVPSSHRYIPDGGRLVGSQSVSSAVISGLHSILGSKNQRTGTTVGEALVEPMTSQQSPMGCMDGPILETGSNP